MPIIAYSFIFALAVAIPMSLWAGLVMAPALVLLALPALFFASSYTHIKPPKGSLPRVILLGLGWIVVSCLWASNIGASLLMAGRIVGLSALCYVAYKQLILLGGVHKQVLSKAFVIIYTLSVLIFLEEVMSQGFLGEYVNNILSSQFYMHDLNRGACVMVVLFWPFFVSLSHLGMTRRQRKILVIAMWLILGGAVSQQLSQSAILAYILSSLVFVFVMMFKKYGQIIMSYMVVLGIILNLFCVSQMEAEPLALKYNNLPESAVHRLFIWEFAGNKAQETFLLGRGVYGSRYVEGANDLIKTKEIEAPSHWVNLPLHPHNSVVQIWLELGIVGVGLFAAFLFLLIKTAAKVQNILCKQSAYIAGIIAYVAVGLVGFGVWQPWWLATGMIAFLILSVARQDASQ